MKLASQKGDPAFAAMTLDIVGNILNRAEDPGNLGIYLTEEVRELTGARCALLLQFQGRGTSAAPRVVGINPHRRKAWAKSASPEKFFETVQSLPEPRLWRGSEPSETADYLHQHGFELSLAIPLNVAGARVGALLALGLPDETHLASVVDLLTALSSTLALVLRNAFLFEKQEQIIQERTAGLQETNEKLRLELIERSRAEEAVSRSEQKYRELVENANSIILRWSADGTVTFLNEFGLKFFGYPESEIIGHPVMETIVPESESSGRNLVHLMDDILKNPHKFEHNINENRCRDGRQVWIAWTNKIVLDEQGRFKEILSVGSDITERKAAEARIARLSQLYAALSQCNQAIVRSDSVEALLPQICRDVVEFGGMKMAWIGMVDKASGMVHPVAAYGSGTEYLDEIEISVDAEKTSGRGPVGIAIRENQPSWFQDFQHEPRSAPWHERAAQYGWGAVASLPLHLKGKPIGSLVIYSGEALAFDEEMRKLLMEMAGDISFALDSFAREAERKRAEENLRESEERFRELVEQAPDAIAVHDIDLDRWVSVNKSAEKLFGCSREELLRSGPLRFYPPNQPDGLPTEESVREHTRRALAGESVLFQRAIRNAQGKDLICEIRLVRQTSSSGRRLLRASIVDITERKRAEELLRASEARFKSMFDEAPLGIALVDSLNARFYSVNPMFAKIAGRSVEELEQIDWKTITHPDDIQGDLDRMAEMNAGKIPGFHMEKRYLHPDGTYVWVNITVAPMYVEDKSHPRHLLMIEEITERKRMEDALRASEARFRALYDKAPMGISRIDSLTGRFLQVNAKSCEIHGRSSREMLEMDFPSITHPDDLEQDLENMKRLREGRIRSFEMDKRLVRPDGSIVWVNLTVVPEWAEGEAPTCHIAMVADITERKQAEEALLKAKEAAETANQAKDQFIAVLSHELRTPLTPVLATVTALNAEDNLPPEIHANLEMIRQNIELEARLIDDLLDVTRIAKGKMTLVQEPMDAHACLRRALEICQGEIEEKHLSLSLDLRAARHHVHGDATRLRQVFWNLLKNSAKFTPPGGSIVIRSANVNERLLIEINDTGIGIEPELLPEIFNQFKQGEQTKARRFGGLGLGLSIAKTVIEMHQGVLTASSEGHGKGAIFTVELDTVAPPAVSPGVVSAPPPAGANIPGQRILLVEDHPDTLRILTKLLQKWGYDVTPAVTVRSALEVAETQAFDLLVSDLGLPDGSGMEVMRILKKRHHLRGIAVSGFGTDEDIRQSRAAGFEEHLIKPISYEALRNAIERITDAAAER